MVHGICHDNGLHSQALAKAPNPHVCPLKALRICFVLRVLLGVPGGLGARSLRTLLFFLTPIEDVMRFSYATLSA